MAREPRPLIPSWLQACDAYLSATLARARYLRAKGRLADPESATDIAALEAERRCIRRHLDRLRSRQPPAAALARLPDDPAGQLALATRRQLRRYHDAVARTPGSCAPAAPRCASGRVPHGGCASWRAVCPRRVPWPVSLCPR